MLPPPVELPLPIDLAGVGIGALQCALFGMVRPHVTVVGVAVFAFVTALGGGLLRDVLIGRGPSANLLDDRIVIVAFAAAAFGILIGRIEHRVTPLLGVLDAGMLGLWAIAGTQKAQRFGFGVLTSVLLGVITGVGGGMMRDVLAGEVPTIFVSGPLYTLAAVAGASLFIVLHLTTLPTLLQTSVCVLLVFSIRMLSVRYGWLLPPASAIAPDLHWSRRWHRQ